MSVAEGVALLATLLGEASWLSKHRSIPTFVYPIAIVFRQARSVANVLRNQHHLH